MNISDIKNSFLGIRFESGGFLGFKVLKVENSMKAARTSPFLDALDSGETTRN